MSAQPYTYMTVDEYLAFEETNPAKHEYYQGRVFLLAGGNEAHAIITSNINAILNLQVRERPCTVYTSDMKVKVERTKLYAYPDVSVVCGPAQFEDTTRRVLLNPTALIEVLSESTEKYDRGKKFQNYRTIDSLQEYLLVAQESMQIDHYVRQPDNFWLLSSASAEDEQIVLPSIHCHLSIKDVYNKVQFDTETDDPSMISE